MSSASTVVEFSVERAWGNVSRMRRMVVGLLTASCPEDEEHAWGVGLAVHELLENAIKYGQGPVKLALVVSSNTGRALSVRVHTEPRQDEHLERLTFELERLRHGCDYQQWISESAANDVSRSGLGLARVYFEAGLALECSRVGGELIITATPRNAQEQTA